MPTDPGHGPHSIQLHLAPPHLDSRDAFPIFPLPNLKHVMLAVRNRERLRWRHEHAEKYCSLRHIPNDNTSLIAIDIFPIFLPPNPKHVMLIVRYKVGVCRTRQQVDLKKTKIWSLRYLPNINTPLMTTRTKAFLLAVTMVLAVTMATCITGSSGRCLEVQTIFGSAKYAGD